MLISDKFGKKDVQMKTRRKILRDLLKIPGTDILIIQFQKD